MRDEDAAIYGYDLCHQEEFMVKSIGDPWNVFDLTTDGETLAWVARSGAGQYVQGYDLSSRREFLMIEAPNRYGFESIALGDGVLYYGYLVDQPGIYAYTPATGREEMIHSQGFDLVFADGKLLWTQEHISGGVVSEKSLHIKNLDTGEQTVVTQVINGYTYFSGYDAFGDTVVWSFFPGADTHVKSYNLSSGISTTISTNSGHYPVIHNHTAMWYEVSSGSEPGNRSIVTYDMISGKKTKLVEESTTNLYTVDILKDGILLFVVTDPYTGRDSLYMSDPDQSGLRFSTKEPYFSGQLSSDGWGRIGAQGRWLYESIDMGFDKWPVYGVQFILPEYDINGESFTNAALDARGPEPDGDGTRLFWLQRAANRLHARTLRIFVPMPGESYNENGNRVNAQKIYNFARDAEAYNMRLGIVIHNSQAFDMSAQKENWLRNLVQVFKNNDALNLIAYINADNEINHHCGGGDCYHVDWWPEYAADANEWVREVVDIVKDEDPALLVTVGMATELVPGVEGMQQTIDNYFEPHEDITLAKEVDFISPHNYGGGAYGIWDHIMTHEYPGPVVLEEYGYPTDPFVPGSNTAAQYRTEGPPECRNDPWVLLIDGSGYPTANCVETATGFIETNIRALGQDRRTDYAGGVAFMLVDTKAAARDNFNFPDDCDDPEATYDYFTGLFAIGTGEDYCEPGGTRTRGLGQLKSTGFRVCLYHSNYSLEKCQEKLYLPLIRR
ncbi:MAG: hypothetical protein HC884_13350 [Chloroflexaceae bacterium]|nr:hypothetical protein [Chloroflexaceae bacterium]